MVFDSFNIFFETYPYAFLVAIFVFGLCIGSFINVIAHRVPMILDNIWHEQCVDFLGVKTDENEIYEYISLSYPKSHCPRCKASIKWYHNIPIISYLFLKGKCNKCKDSISFRYPIVEFLTATLFTIQAYYFGISMELLASFVLTGSLISLSLIDLDHKMLPDHITIPIMWIGLNLNIVNLFTSLDEAILGATLGYLSLWIFAKTYEKISGKFAMGHGDFKMLAMAGAWLGWQQLPIIVMLSSLLGSIVGLSMIMLKINEQNTKIPFGPYLAIAIWCSLIWGDNIMIYYLNWLDLK